MLTYPLSIQIKLKGRSPKHYRLAVIWMQSKDKSFPNWATFQYRILSTTPDFFLNFLCGSKKFGSERIKLFSCPFMWYNWLAIFYSTAFWLIHESLLCLIAVWSISPILQALHNVFGMCFMQDVLHRHLGLPKISTEI